MRMEDSVEAKMALGAAAGKVKMARHLMTVDDMKIHEDIDDYDEMFKLLWDLGQDLLKLEQFRIPR